MIPIRSVARPLVLPSRTINSEAEGPVSDDGSTFPSCIPNFSSPPVCKDTANAVIQTIALSCLEEKIYSLEQPVYSRAGMSKMTMGDYLVVSGEPQSSFLNDGVDVQPQQLIPEITQLQIMTKLAGKASTSSTLR